MSTKQGKSGTLLSDLLDAHQDALNQVKRVEARLQHLEDSDGLEWTVQGSCGLRSNSIQRKINRDRSRVETHLELHLRGHVG